jgi:hypothetical protein
LAVRLPPTPLVLTALAWSCDRPTSEGLGCERTFYADADGDGYGDAARPTTACLAPEGYDVRSDDCNDRDAAIHPEADELCNTLDDDCDGQTDSVDPNLVEGDVYYADTDIDGFGDPATGSHACETPADRVLDSTDCDDTEARAHPLADETCDLLDNDCDGLVDLDDESVVDSLPYYADADGDGFGIDETWVVECFAPAGYYASLAGDCDDHERDVHPDATEVCDEVDNDCDGHVDDVETCEAAL